VGKDTRSTVINWPNQLQSIVDGYEGYKGLVHGVQKDAIQNGWDARKTKKGKNWKFTFELIQKKNNYLAMTDEGTHGLTGRVLRPEELQEDLPQNERWGRFENLAFTKEHSTQFSTLGSRGRGKFIFLGASKNNEIIYDSLRDDGTYRLGVRTLTLIDSPTYSWDGDEAKLMLVTITSGAIKPLEKVGTRVVIIEPVEELVEDFKSGNFLNYINETWWEIILKYSAKIIVKCDGIEYCASIPEEFALLEEDSNKYKSWIKNKESIKIRNTRFKLNKLQIMSDRENPIPKHLQGISIQRGGMKVCAIEPRFLPQEIAESIYGFIRLDTSDELALLEAEGPEHYSFNFRKALPWAVRHYVEAELNVFAQKKLGWRSDLRKIRRQRQKDAERRALSAINQMAKKIGLMGIGTGSRKKDGGSRASKSLRIQMQVSFPRSNDQRVNYGESITNLSVRIINEEITPIKVKIRFFLRYYEKVISNYVDQDIMVSSRSTTEYFGPFEEKFTKEIHTDTGEYTLVARIISLKEGNRGEKLDEKRRKIFLEQDPPAGGIFERCDPLEFPEPIIELMGEAIPGERGGYILQYNVKHPEQEIVQDSEEQLAKYLFRILAHELCRIDIGQEEPRLYNKNDLDSPDFILRKTLNIVSEFIYKYHIS